MRFIYEPSGSYTSRPACPQAASLIYKLLAQDENRISRNQLSAPIYRKKELQSAIILRFINGSRRRLQGINVQNYKARNNLLLPRNLIQ